jgi:hypothetical protein
MPPPCSICTSPKRAAVDADLVGQVAIRIVSDRHGVSLGAINRHKAHIAHLTTAAEARVASVKQRAEVQYQGAQVEVGALLQQRADERHGVAMRLAGRAEAALERLERFQTEFESYATRGEPGDIVKPEDLEDSFSQRAEAVAKLAASAASTLTAAISALGGGAGKHDEMRGKLSGDLKNTLTIEGALKVIFEKGKLTPEARAALNEETRAYLAAGVEHVVRMLPAGQQQAARQGAMAAAAEEWRKREGKG